VRSPGNHSDIASVWPFRIEYPVAGRVVLVMHLIAFQRLGAGSLTTTMGHRGGCDHGNAPSSWLPRPGTGPGL
jgi:hypothetical protein